MTQGSVDGTYVRFNQAPTNMQAEITKDLGAFRCSVPGLYFFTFSAMAPSRGSFRVSLRRNRVPVVTAFASHNGFSWASNSAVLYLAPNDLVYLYLEEGDIYESSAQNRAFTSFSGFLVGDESHHLLGRNPVEEEMGAPDPADEIFQKLALIRRKGTV
ncbi:conserved hypothetical protein [Ixodes scapularis]|uniref:C1q domain-containing protein n=1 Tax=Ixodes scapularis TaxID=6945 RepID=B7QIU4_IXOSC|nr:conserved hypothetical protein [Ixodes scapularis]|eukprot:XP_002415101.1 conserved hypothetical protein [Ixodes scapularis]